MRGLRHNLSLADYTPLASLVREFRDTLGIELVPQPLDTSSSADGEHENVTKKHRLPLAPRPAAARARRRSVWPGLVPPAGFSSSRQDRIATRIARLPQPAVKPPVEPQLEEHATDRFVPLRRSGLWSDAVTANERPCRRPLPAAPPDAAPGVRRRPGTGPGQSLSHSRLQQVTQWLQGPRGAFLSLMLGVGLGLVLALLGAAVLLVLT